MLNCCADEKTVLVYDQNVIIFFVNHFSSLAFDLSDPQLVICVNIL